MGAPQIIIIAIYALGFGSTLSRHGEEKQGKENALISFIGMAIQIALLWWGGFWR